MAKDSLELLMCIRKILFRVSIKASDSGFMAIIIHVLSRKGGGEMTKRCLQDFELFPVLVFGG